MTRVFNHTSGPITFDSEGRVVGGGSYVDVDLTDPITKRLVDEGHLIVTGTPPAPVPVAPVPVKPTPVPVKKPTAADIAAAEAAAKAAEAAAQAAEKAAEELAAEAGS